jgi:hypothetical protein
VLGDIAVGELVEKKAARTARIWWIALIAAFGLMMLINPSGFIGGGQDDWHYLQAARCLREHGLCLPHDHWEARWPVVAPIAFFTHLLGESRFSVSIAPATASFCALILLALIGNRLFRRPVGWIAALLLLLTPAFAVQLSQPSVEATELCFIFAGFLALLKWQERSDLLWAFASGLLFSLAIQVRETAFVAAPFAFAYLCVGKPKPKLLDLLPASVGFALPFLAEFAWFALSVGDPFYRLELSIRHTQIWSSELLGPIDKTHSPFFNKSYIANWRMEPGIHVYWAIDGLLNLFVNGLAGLSLPFVTMTLLFGRTKIGLDVWRKGLTLVLTAIAYMACLIYPFAVDPKARMMLVALSMTNLALALVFLRLREIGHALVAYALLFAAAILGIILQYGHQRSSLIEMAASRWISLYPCQIEIESSTRKYLALVPSARPLPNLDAEKPLLLFASAKSCRNWVKASGLSRSDITIVGTAKNTRIDLPGVGGELCLLHYERSIPGEKMKSIIDRVRLLEGVEQRRSFVPNVEFRGNTTR